jgi:hypothetical protein
VDPVVLAGACVRHFRAEETAHLYSFVDADVERSSPQAFFKTLPDEMSLAPIDFAPLTDRSLYEEWLAGRD